MEPSSQVPLDLIKIWLGYIWPFLNTSFITALFGAFAGAWAAIKIAEKGEMKRAVLKEVHATNKAISLAFCITNSLLNFKKNDGQKLRRDFDLGKSRWDDFQEKLMVEASSGEDELVFSGDLRSFPFFNLPVDALNNIIYEKTFNLPELSLVEQLGQSLSSLNDCIERREVVISHIKKMQERNCSDKEISKIYFGTRQDNGVMDTTYPDCITGISGALDDCLFFSKHIGMKLEKYAKSLTKGKVPSVASVDFSEAEMEGLFPDSENYKQWIR